MTVRGKMKAPIPIFVISLENATNRRASLLAQLDGFDLEYRVFNAVDGRHGLPGELEVLIDRDASMANLGRPMADVECACALSHIEVYRLILNLDLGGAIVFEDDASLKPEFPKLLDRIEFEKIDMLMFDYGFARYWRFGGKRVKGTSYELLRLAHNAGLASAYYISAKGARFILDKGLPVSMPADWPCDLRALRPQVVYPRIASQGSRDSYLEQARADARQVLGLSRGAFSKRRMMRHLRGRARNPVPWYLFWGFLRIFTNIIDKDRRGSRSQMDMTVGVRRSAERRSWRRS